MKEGNLQYKRSFLIICYVVLIQFLILPFYEIPTLQGEQLNQYIICKTLIALMFVALVLCIHSLRLVKYWVILFHVSCFSFILIGQYFNPGYHYTAIQFMYVSAIIFEGFPFMSTLLMILFLVEYSLHPFSGTNYSAYPFYHDDVFNAIISSWIISVLLERYVNRVKNKQGLLDKKLRYKGIKTDLFMHDLKNRLQVLISQPSETRDYQEVILKIQEFNSFKNEDEIEFEQVVLRAKDKNKINAEIVVSGSTDFFIDQMDLETLLSNLMKTSQSLYKNQNSDLSIHIKNKKTGFIYEDNAGEMSEDLIRVLAQKDSNQKYPTTEKSGFGLFLAKKLVECHGGSFSAKKIASGTRYEIAY